MQLVCKGCELYRFLLIKSKHLTFSKRHNNDSLLNRETVCNVQL